MLRRTEEGEICCSSEFRESYRPGANLPREPVTCHYILLNHSLSSQHTQTSLSPRRGLPSYCYKGCWLCSLMCFLCGKIEDVGWSPLFSDRHSTDPTAVSKMPLLESLIRNYISIFRKFLVIVHFPSRV